MLNQFIAWLVTKFLTKVETLRLIVDQSFVENPRETIDKLYRIACHTETGRAIVPLDTVAAKIMSEGSLTDNVYITVLLTLKNKLLHCGDKGCTESGYMEFFEEVARIKDQTSVLKIRKELNDHVRLNTWFTEESDVALVSHVLQNSYINPAVITEFLNNLGA